MMDRRLTHAFADQARAQAFGQLRARCEQPDTPASTDASLANLYHLRRNLDAAIQHYECVLRLAYGQAGWHCTLAKLLAQADRVGEALQEAEICLRLREDFAPAKRLIEILSVQRHPGGHRPRANSITQVSGRP